MLISIDTVKAFEKYPTSAPDKDPLYLRIRGYFLTLIKVSTKKHIINIKLNNKRLRIKQPCLL